MEEKWLNEHVRTSKEVSFCSRSAPTTKLLSSHEGAKIVKRKKVCKLKVTGHY